MIKAVLFDMNGVIISDEHIHELAFRETVKPLGINLTHHDYLSCCAGKTDLAGYEAIVDHFAVDLPISQLLLEKNYRYRELFPQHKQSPPGVIELIKNLAIDFTLAVTSAATREEVDLVTHEFGIRKYFKITISANDVSKGKPDPEPYLKTAQLLNLAPAECAVIEDSPSGVAAAKAAGCYCIGITTTHTVKDLEAADLVVDSFGDISTEIIQNLL